MASAQTVPVPDVSGPLLAQEPVAGAAPGAPTTAESRATSTAIAAPASEDRQESPSRKRRRSDKSYPPTPRSRPSPVAGTVKATSPAPDQIAPTLTGAAALAEQQRVREEQESLEARQTSPNPSRKAIEGLLGSRGGMSQSADTPKATTTAAASPAMEVQRAGGAMQTSPGSMASIEEASADRQDHMSTVNGIAAATTASPAPMDEGPDDENAGRSQTDPHPSSSVVDFDKAHASKSLTYPAPLTAHPQRTQSMPQSGYGGDDTRSPSTKRHKCPYCDTDFTRHHNLKSHLLTHSHEKPYSCDTCDSRFRRLHDLKRHTKLHTGERPHVCPKCDRSFARGDALARHTKGQGGCAGRRSSMGSFGGDDKQDGLRPGEGEGMAGIMYTAEASHEPEPMDEDMDATSGRSLPSIRKYEAPMDPHGRAASDHPMFSSRGSSTYPPVAACPPNSGGLYPPPNTSPRSTDPALASSNPYPSIQPPGSYQNSGLGVYPSGGMTESPKPLSPNTSSGHQLGSAGSGNQLNRSPTLNEHYQPNHFARRSTAGQSSPPPATLPPPPPSNNHSAAPHLPPLSGLTAPEPRFTLPSQAGVNMSGGPMGPHSPSYPPGNTSGNNSLSSHSTGPMNSLDRTQSTYGQSNDRLWAYVQGLEDKVNRLEKEVAALRNTPVGPPPHR